MEQAGMSQLKVISSNLLSRCLIFVRVSWGWFFFSMRFQRNWKYLVAQTLQHAVSNLQLPKPSKSNPMRDSSFFNPCTLENKNGQQPFSFSSSSFTEQIPAAGAVSLEAALLDSRTEAQCSLQQAIQFVATASPFIFFFFSFFFFFVKWENFRGKHRGLDSEHCTVCWP